MAAHRMTPARRAALKKAQAASARKRKRGALARNVGRGVVGSKRGSRKGRYKVARKVGGHLRRNAVVYGAGAALIGAHVAGRHLAKNEASRRRKATARPTTYHTTNKPKFKYKSAQAHSGRATKHNRTFVTTRHGTTSVRKRY